MNRFCEHGSESPCPLRYICHCLRITEDAVAEAIATKDLRTLPEIKRHTGAGDGCMACHRRLVRFLEREALATA